MARVLSALLLLALLPATGLADTSCFGLCSAICVRPISIPDRWNDNGVPGSTGWSNNGVWDRERFTDTNGNGIHDPGEPFQDGTSAYTFGGAGPIDGQYNEESFDPLSTGYVASKDLGLEITLKAGIPSGATAGTQYYALDLPVPGDGSTGAARYRWNWANCNPNPVSISDRLVTENGDMNGPTGQAMRDLIDQDPGAYWDDGCQCVKSDLGDESPRLLVLPAQDPRIPLSPGKQSLVVSKLVGFFLEAADVNGNVRGRFVQIHQTGSNSCTNGGDFIVDCAVATKTTTWGALKGAYR